MRSPPAPALIVVYARCSQRCGFYGDRSAALHKGAAFLLRWSPQEKGGSTMAQGTVKWFSDDKGFGFITPDEGGEDLFVHHTGIAGSGFKSLEEGAKVSYEASQGRKGMQADDVSPVQQAGLRPEG